MTKTTYSQYIKSKDFQISKDFVFQIREEQYNKLKNKYPKYTIHQLKKEYDLTSYFKTYDVPFFDIVLYTMYENSATFETTIDIEMFTKQMNIFIKNIFLRKFWNENFPDKFCKFIWENYKTHQYNYEFDKLEKIAYDIYVKSQNISDFLKNFIYNFDYQYIKENDSIELIEYLSNNNYLNNKSLKIKIPNMVNHLEDNYDLYNSGFRSKASHEIFYSKVYPVLQKCNTKFKIIPIMDKDKLKSIFRGSFTYYKMNKDYYLVPQFLVFQ